MKKTIAILLFLLCLLSSCSLKENNNDNFLGKWIAVCGELEKMPLSGDEIENYFFTLKRNGRVTLNCGENKYRGKWKCENENFTLIFNKKIYNGTYKNNTINIKNLFGENSNLTFARFQTKECDPMLYMSNEAKNMLGNWKSTAVYDVLGNETKENYNIELDFSSDYTVEITLNGKKYRKQKWYVSQNFGGLKNGDYDISWECFENKIDVIALINGEYYVFKCEK